MVLQPGLVTLFEERDNHKSTPGLSTNRTALRNFWSSLNTGEHTQYINILKVVVRKEHYQYHLDDNSNIKRTK